MVTDDEENMSMYLGRSIKNWPYEQQPTSNGIYDHVISSFGDRNEFDSNGFKMSTPTHILEIFHRAAFDCYKNWILNYIFIKIWNFQNIFVQSEITG